MFPKFLEATAADGVWKPINNKVHLICESSQYNMTIADEVIKTLPQSKFTLATITDIQNPVQDWGPVMQAIKQEGCGTIMLDYWSASEEAAFCQQFINDPVKGALVYIHYGPSQTEFLQIASGAAEGMVWSTMFGIYPNAQGKEFRAKFQRRHPGPVPLSCPALAYDTVNVLKNAWQSADPSDFKAVADYIRTHPYRGVVGTINMNNEDQAGLHYPMQTKDMNQGMAQLYYQVQDGEHKVIQPTALAESKFKSVPWA
ncbi:ABC transporter substrate-binding protein (plasmid) [Mesorhizobium sp. ORM8.1]